MVLESWLWFKKDPQKSFGLGFCYLISVMLKSMSTSRHGISGKWIKGRISWKDETVTSPATMLLFPGQSPSVKVTLSVLFYI